MGYRIMKAGDKEMHFAATVVKRGGLVVYPTETLYGLGCDAYNKHAIERVFKIKRRTDKPLPILVSSLRKASELAYFSPAALAVAKRFWPGPLTLVLERRENFPPMGGELQTVGLRIPKHPVAVKLARLCGGCIIGTSANRSGSKPPRTAEEAAEQLDGEVDLVLDGEKTTLGLGSTVLDLTGKPKILRFGAISRRELASFLTSIGCEF